MPVKLLIFDLDGTLIDSAEDIARSVNELRSEWGRSPLPSSQVYGYIGEGVRRLLERSLPGAEQDELDRAQKRYLEIYRRRLLDHTRPYPGVGEALEALHPGRFLAVLTNKPTRESLRILEGLELARYFGAVYGGDAFPSRKPDPIGVRRLLEMAGSSPEEALFVGDSRVDLETAQNASIRCCLVSYGIRPEETDGLDADFRVDDLRELVPIVAES